MPRYAGDGRMQSAVPGSAAAKSRPRPRVVLAPRFLRRLALVSKRAHMVAGFDAHLRRIITAIIADFICEAGSVVGEHEEPAARFDGDSRYRLYTGIAASISPSDMRRRLLQAGMFNKAFDEED